MRLAVLKYDQNGNIGDEIQTLAAEQFLPKIDARLDRDTLKTSPQSSPTLVLTNGWFAKHPSQSLPAADGIKPVFFSFHIANHGDWTYFLSEPCIDYFRKHQPIGCRDRKTAERLRERGVETYYTKCLTITFPRRTATPAKGRVFIVDVATDSVNIPRALRDDAVHYSHRCPAQFDDETKRMMARKALEMYRDHASLVITSRLHCALPCAAMGIPVVFFGNPDDTRIALLEDIGIRIHPYKRFKHRLFRFFYKAYFGLFRAPKIDWSPKPLELEEEKGRISAAVRKALKENGVG